MECWAGQNSGCEISGECEMSADRISDVRYPEKMERWAGQNSECEISGEGGTLAGQNSECEISGEGKSRRC